MRATKSVLNVLALSALLLVCASMAQAQATRTWVSGVGDDANPCSRTAPCKTFAGAISKTAAGGEINVLDPGGFGALTITKAITVQADGATAGVLHTLNSSGIIVNAGVNDVVVLRGLDFEAVGTGGNSIRFLAGSALVVENCILRNGAQKGIDFQPSGNSTLIVNDTTINNFNNAVNGGAILIKPSGAGTAKAVITNSRMTRSLFGVRAENGSTVVIKDSVASLNSANGIQAVSVLNGALDVSVDNSVISGNGNGVRSEGSVAAIVRLSRNVITSNALGLSSATGGQIISYGNNQNTGNASNNNGAPTSTVLLQ